MCSEWKDDFWAFQRDMGNAPDGMQIDRISPFGNYEPKNCRWATIQQQANNKKHHHLPDQETKYKPRKPMKLTCQMCHNEFDAKRADASYCSSRCRVAANRAKPTTGTPAPPKPRKPAKPPLPTLPHGMGDTIKAVVASGPKPVTTSTKKAKTSTPKEDPLAAAIAKINKDYGEGTIMLMGSCFRAKVDVIPTGNLAIDHALGVGGMPRGRIVEVFGPESAGKTTLCLSVIAQAQAMGLRAAIIDVENAIDFSYAKALGVDLDAVHIIQPDSGEEALQSLKTLVETNALGVVVVDSVAALVPRQEDEGEIGDAAIGSQARLMSQAMRLLQAPVRKSNTLVLFTNQIRMKVGVVGWQSPETTSGGKALPFAASMRLRMSRIGSLKDSQGNIYGARTQIEVKKNKVAVPNKKVEFDLVFGEGIGGPGSLIDLALQHDILQKRGSWISYQGSQLAQGREAAKAHLTSDPVLRAEIEDKVRETMAGGASPLTETTTQEEEELPG